jgi:DNA uptake protein ComE-like DNA-binding protein
MTSKSTVEAQDLSAQVLKELESPKGSVVSAVTKLLRVAKILNDRAVQVWCEIQLGEQLYTSPLRKMVAIAMDPKLDNKEDEVQKQLAPIFEQLGKLELRQEDHYPHEELIVKSNESGGGYINIGFVEERYADLVRMKRGNDGTFYKNNLNAHLNYVRKAAHARATQLYNKLAYADTPQSSFDVLKGAVDDKLLDIAPEQSEQLMLAFRAVTDDKPESWSQALTSCRRLIKGLADTLKPVTSKETVGGRPLTSEQYINRLWAFMDEAIESDANRELAKAHVDLLGSYLERTDKITSKGVHAKLGRIEAVKAVFHTYLMIADILGYLEQKPKSSPNVLDIAKATLDELESVLGVSREIAKRIVRLRVENPKLTFADLSKVPGISQEALKVAKSQLRFP